MGILRASQIAVIVGLVMACSVSASAQGDAPTLVDLDPEDCNERVPVSYAIPAPTYSRIAIDATILLDGVSRSDAEAMVAGANSAYSPIGLEITPTFRRLNVKPDRIQKNELGKTVEGVEVTKLVDAVKKAVGGSRPKGSDVVYALTDKDVYLEAGDVLGWAECIGGVRYPTRAFAAGEAPESFKNIALNFYVDAGAKILGHEIGHLLGAHHEYGNCVQGAGPEDAANLEPATCTLMFGYLDFQSLDLGAVDGSVLRGHAEDFATP